MIKVFQTSGWCYIAPSNREPVMILKDGAPTPLALESLIRGEQIFDWVTPRTKEKVYWGRTHTVDCKITAADIRA